MFSFCFKGKGKKAAPLEEPRSGFGTPKFSPQANSEGTSDGSTSMPGYKFFKDATEKISRQQKVGSGRYGEVYKQLEDEARLSVLTDDDRPRPPSRFKGAQMDFSLEPNNKDSNGSQSQQLEDEDRLSTLPDDILLCILGRVSSCMAARTCVLSTRWRDLLWLLPEVTIDVKDFLSVPCPNPIAENDMEEAMMSLTKATSSFLANRQRESTISSLHLKLYLIKTFLGEVGPLVGDVIDSCLLKDLDLTVLDETDHLVHSDEDMLQRAQEIDTFFRTYSSVLHCLTKLSLKNADFNNLDMHHVLFDCCKQLKHLSLYCCDTGTYSVFKIDAPNSKLCFLDIKCCRFERLELVCLPKLEKFICTIWKSKHVPVTFGFVPSLGELELSCAASYNYRPFKLSELLHGTSIHTLKFDFQGEILWLLPEVEELRTAFSKLQKLSLCGIFVEFDILWTTAFLVAAPSIERLCIQVWEHACDVEEYFRDGAFSDRETPQWEMSFDGSENRRLKVLDFCGFKSLEQQFTFIRSMLERSPNLQKIVMRGDEECDACNDLVASLSLSKFPRKKDDQEMVVKRIRGGIFSPEIIFDEDWSLKV